MKPKVSVVMPVLNGERFIGDALRSIASQTYKNLELILVDDGSTDATIARTQPFRRELEIRDVRHETPRGIAVSVNDGVRQASGDFIAFLDHDDEYFPEFLETQMKYLQDHPDVGMVHSDFQTIDGEGKVIEESVATSRNRQRPNGHVFRELFMDSFIVGNSVLIRREVLEHVGLFDESLRWGDYHLWLRIARHYKIDYVNKVLTKYRQHSSQCTRTNTGQTVAAPDAPPVPLQAIQKLVEQYPELREELGESTIRHRMSSFYFDVAYTWFTNGEFANARLCLRRALALWPTNTRYLAVYVATLLGPAQARAARDAWRRFRGEPQLAARGRMTQ